MDFRRCVLGPPADHETSLPALISIAPVALPHDPKGRRRPGRMTVKFWTQLAAILFATLGSLQGAPTVSLAWDRNPESDIAGYRLKYGTQSGVPTATIEVGNDTAITVTDLSYSTTYYFTVVAYNTADLESPPSNEVSYKTLPPEVHTLTVENGTGGGDYEPGTRVPVAAYPAPRDQKFERWMEDYQVLLVPTAEKTTATIPYRDVKITATYSDLPKYTLTVNSGSGGGSYTAGTVVSINANPPASGRVFSTWTGQDATLLSSRTSPTTTLTMPARAASVTASYVTGYRLTVNAGTGGGTYAAGRVVTVEANPPPSGQRFSTWTGDTGTLASRTSSKTTLTVPSRNTSITATYRRR